jgi:hypothetical protein
VLLRQYADAVMPTAWQPVAAPTFRFTRTRVLRED